MILGDVRIGENSYANDSGMLLAYPPNTITVGKDCAIGHWVYMNTRMHKTEEHLQYFTGDIMIEDHCWLGNGVVVYPGVTIGRDCIIGAHCVITHDIAPGKIVYILQEMREK